MTKLKTATNVVAAVWCLGIALLMIATVAGGQGAFQDNAAKLAAAASLVLMPLMLANGIAHLRRPRMVTK